MGFGDQMQFGDGMTVRMSCAHNHPEQGDEIFCKLCGTHLPLLKEDNEDDGNPRNRSG